MADKVILDRFESALKKADTLLQDHGTKARSDTMSPGPYREWQSQSLALLRSVFGADHTYATTFDQWTTKWNGPAYVETGIGTLRAAFEDISKGYTWTLKELVHADLFDDYLEMAESLNNDGYMDAAAVIAGSTLEAHLRSLCNKKPIPITDAKGNAKKAAMMNQDLYSSSVYDKTNLKLVDAWLTIRNDPAHGHYNKYDQKQIEQMIEGIRQFLARNPA